MDIDEIIVQSKISISTWSLKQEIFFDIELQAVTPLNNGEIGNT